MTGAAWRIGLVVVALALAGCSRGIDSLSFAPPPDTTIAPLPPPDTLPPGLASVTESGVAGVPTTIAPSIGPGTAAISGTVTGPTGPTGGATVEIDRFTPDGFASARTTTAADGTWSFRQILGGSFRVRAWLAPALAMAAPQTLFVSAGQPVSVQLQLASYTGPAVQVAINPAAPVINQPVNMVIQVTNPTVDANGIVTSTPVSGTKVTLVNGPNWQVQNGNPITTDATGQALFTVQCTVLGSDPLAAQLGTSPPVNLQMPACSTPPPSTTTTTTNPFSSTSTTCPTTPGGTGHRKSTTTTSAFSSC